MGIAAFFAPISPDRLEALMADPSQVEPFLFPEDDDSDAEPEGTVDVDKAWHGLHFLLCALAAADDSPLKWAVLGGAELGEDTGYGPPRALQPAQVKQVAAALSEISIAQLKSAFDPAAMSAADIYPDIWERDGVEALDYLVHDFPVLASFYADTAQRGQGAILCLA